MKFDSNSGSPENSGSSRNSEQNRPLQIQSVMPSGLSCEFVERTIHIRQGLSLPSNVRQHVRTCSHCRQEAQEALPLSHMNPLPPLGQPQDLLFTRSVMAQVRAEVVPAQREIRLAKIRMSWVACLIVSILSGIFWLSLSNESNHVLRSSENSVAAHSNEAGGRSGAASLEDDKDTVTLLSLLGHESSAPEYRFPAPMIVVDPETHGHETLSPFIQVDGEGQSTHCVTF